MMVMKEDGAAYLTIVVCEMLKQKSLFSEMQATDMFHERVALIYPMRSRQN